ncbi:MAG: ethanolamine ammonia-lyase subunit EutB, partial [Gammaproteobacteria bacterium]
ADDVLLNYQSTTFHDALYLREVLGLKHAPEFEDWLERMQVTRHGRLRELGGNEALVQRLLARGVP